MGGRRDKVGLLLIPDSDFSHTRHSVDLIWRAWGIGRLEQEVLSKKLRAEALKLLEGDSVWHLGGQQLCRRQTTAAPCDVPQDQVDALEPNILVRRRTPLILPWMRRQVEFHHQLGDRGISKSFLLLEVEIVNKTSVTALLKALYY